MEGLVPLLGAAAAPRAALRLRRCLRASGRLAAGWHLRARSPRIVRLPRRPLTCARPPRARLRPQASKPKGGATVPESVLKKRKRVEKYEAAAKEKAAAATKKAAASKETAFKRAEAYTKEYREQEASLVTMRRAARKAGTFYVEPEPKLLFVMRLRGINGMHPKTRHIMKVLRLLQMNNGVFMQVNKAVMNNLQKVDPYIMYGYPTLKTVRELVYKRGYGKVNKQRIPIDNNAVVEQVLGKYDIVCVEDVIHELFTTGPHFKEVANFLWPCKLSSPTGGFKMKLLHYNEGGDAGDRGEKIHELVKKMI